jgi:hypothetical protein
MSQKESFKVVYTDTAFEQDSGQAMKNDIVRALIELITNCDDAYSRANVTGPIDIVVRRSTVKDVPTTLTVRDHATGLNPKEMKESFGVLGGDKSGFAEGQEVRGLFSRGSKDTAWFGETLFESIKDGEYTRLLLTSKMMGEIESVDADSSHYSSLGLDDGENGLSATIVVQRRDTRIPELRDLVDRLSRHVQLRQVVSTQDVSIIEFRDGKLTQSTKVLWEVPASSVVLDEVVSIPGYDSVAHVCISRLHERSDGPVTDYSVHGLEVRGSRAAYMNTLFGQTGTAVGLVYGVVSCPKIDDLIRSFSSDGDDELNPMRMVSRSRDGLEEGHPFMKALTIAVLEKLKPILADLEPKNSDAGGSELRRDLDTLGRLLAEKMKDDLGDDDDDDHGGDVPTSSNPIIVIPPMLRARLGSKSTVTVLVHEGSVAALGLKASVSSSACEVVGVSTELLPHLSFAETLVGQVRLEMLALGSGSVVVSAVSDPSITGNCHVLVHDNSFEETEPTCLEWKNSSMSVTVGKTRSVRLRAPISLAPQGELTARITLASDNIELVDEMIVLKLSKKGWLEGRVFVTGASHSSAVSSLSASAAGEIAEGTIRTTVPNPLGGLNLDVELVNDKKGPIRGEIVSEDSGKVLYIYGRHSALNDRLGQFKDGEYSREREIDTLVVMAEIMASVAADHVLMEKVKKSPEMFSDIDNIVYERTKLLDKYVNILVEGLRVTASK